MTQHRTTAATDVPGKPHNQKQSQTSTKASAGGNSPPNIRPATTNALYINFRGYYGTTAKAVAALCGDTPPTITGGYAKWHSETRPLRRAVTVFDGYDAATMTVNVRFGRWTSAGWDITAGPQVEEDIGIIEWMAGAHFSAGASPYVYVNTYQGDGTSSPLVPLQYQQTAGINGNLQDPSLWPWVIPGGISWGQAWRDDSGYRVYQEATIKLMAFEGFSGQGQHVTTSAGGYFVSKPGRDDALLIASAHDVHALYVDVLAAQILRDPKNNPIVGTHMRLAGKTKRTHIPHDYAVWVPQHQV